jgi:hypothetical protein
MNYVIKISKRGRKDDIFCHDQTKKEIDVSS